MSSKEPQDDGPEPQLGPELQEGPEPQDGPEPQQGRRRKRTRFDKNQYKILIDAFEADAYPDINVRVELANQIQIPEPRIQVWFQNRRARILMKNAQKMKKPHVVPGRTQGEVGAPVQDGNGDPVPGSSQGGLYVPVPEACQGGLYVPVPESCQGGLYVPVLGSSQGGLYAPVPGPSQGGLYAPVPESNQEGLYAPIPGPNQGKFCAPSFSCQQGPLAAQRDASHFWNPEDIPGQAIFLGYFGNRGVNIALPNTEIPAEEPSGNPNCSFFSGFSPTFLTTSQQPFSWAEAGSEDLGGLGVPLAGNQALQDWRQHLPSGEQQSWWNQQPPPPPLPTAVLEPQVPPQQLLSQNPEAWEPPQSHSPLLPSPASPSPQPRLPQAHLASPPRLILPQAYPGEVPVGHRSRFHPYLQQRTLVGHRRASQASAPAAMGATLEAPATAK